jgi:hypothetical protein
MAEAKIMKCTCKSDFQDSLYGKFFRVWNPCGKGKDQGDGYRCSVCGNVEGKASKKVKK